MGYVPYDPPGPRMLRYPAWSFRILSWLGEHAFVREAKAQIDAINHIRLKESKLSRDASGAVRKRVWIDCDTVERVKILHGDPIGVVARRLPTTLPPDGWPTPPSIRVIKT